MTSLTLARSIAARRLCGLAELSPPTTSSTAGRPQVRHAGVGSWTCEISTCNRTSITRRKGDNLSIPCSPTCPTVSARGFASTTAKHNTPRPKNHGGNKRRGRPLAILTIAILGAALFSTATDTGNPFGKPPTGLLNSESFVPFKVVSTERTSPTTFILTVSAPAPHEADNAALIEDAWSHGLWSVEIKQPQLQIARNYTPLPPAPVPAPAPANYPLRFLVRKYDGGEVSTYLSRLGPGDDVWLRGPHLGFDVAARLGAAGERVVFLAGGTGVAPALQVARHLLSMRKGGEQGRKLSMEIIWASRSRADCAGCPRLLQRDGGRGFWGRIASVAGGSAPAGDQDMDGLQNPIVRELRELQAVYRSQGHALEFRCVADDEAGVISGADVTRATGPSRTPSPSTAMERAPCYYHSQRLLQHSTHESDVELKGQGQLGPDTAAGECACGGKGVNGKNLLMISGPDGFVSAYVGSKVWTDGAERQGPVGGLVRKLVQKSPEAWRDWLVLKQ